MLFNRYKLAGNREYFPVFIFYADRPACHIDADDWVDIPVDIAFHIGVPALVVKFLFSHPSPPFGASYGNTSISVVSLTSIIT